MKISQIVLHQPAGLLRVQTNTGFEGFCTGVTATGDDVDRVASILVHSDPLDRERSSRALKEIEDDLTASRRAEVDVALWDLCAKIANRPLFRHVGGFRSRIPVCRIGTSEGGSAQKIIQEAVDARKAGFKAYRFGLLPGENVLARGNALRDLLREVRAAVGPDFPLIFDGQNRCMTDEAIRIGRALDTADYFCFDRPRPRNDHSGGQQVSGAIDTPTSADVTGPMAASQVMAAQSADHIRTSARSAGGFTDVLKCARCAEAFGAYCHLDGVGICDGFAHLHLAGALRNMPFIEMRAEENDACASTFVCNPLRVTDGFVHVPDLPGLGMGIDLGIVMDYTSERIES